MATWQAKCWLGSATGYQTLEVQANSFSGAEQQLKRIYGAQQIINLRRVSQRNGMIASDMSDADATAVVIDNLFKLIGILIALLVKGIVRLYQHLQNSRKV